MFATLKGGLAQLGQYLHVIGSPFVSWGTKLNILSFRYDLFIPTQLQFLHCQPILLPRAVVVSLSCEHSAVYYFILIGVLEEKIK